MIWHSADFWKFDLRSRFEARNGLYFQRNTKSSWFEIWPIFESLINDRDLRSEMDSDCNVIQNHHDSTFGRFLNVWSAIEIWGQIWILCPMQWKIIMIQDSADVWKFDLRSRLEVRNGFRTQRNAKSSWFNIRPIFEILICDRDWRSEMDFELNEAKTSWF